MSKTPKGFEEIVLGLVEKTPEKFQSAYKFEGNVSITEITEILVIASGCVNTIQNASRMEALNVISEYHQMLIGRLVGLAVKLRRAEDKLMAVEIEKACGGEK
jgi:hypothetical protein